MISLLGDVVLKVKVDPTYTLIKSDRLKDLNIRRNSKKKQNLARMSAIHEAKKKAKLLIAEPSRPVLENVIHVDRFQEMIIVLFVGYVDARTALLILQN